MGASGRIPADVRARIEKAREETKRASAALDVHARDLMLAGTDMDTIALVQMMRAYVDGAIGQLEQALRSGSGSGSGSGEAGASR